mmetsp:Transcript_16298/g.52176  ORF Transcript_16298/g.52176 Transcript_16298/m.52176 type:complete len:1056 (-) Transcript_16298:3-3170(-)
MRDMEAKRADRVSIKAVACRAKRRFVDTFFQLQDREEQQFLSSVLRSLPLLLKETVMMQDVKQAIFDMEGGCTGASELMGVAFKSLHKLKMLTSRVCWDLNTTLRQQHDALNRNHDRLKEQFTTVRLSYLVELSSLRDRLRLRSDPEEVLKNLDDIAFFYDPAASLSEDEMSFMTKAVKEKLKMILEHAPGSQFTINMDQLNSLDKHTDNKQVKDLEAALGRQLRENGELKERLASFQSALSSDSIASAAALAKNALAAKPAAPKGQNEEVVDRLEAKIEQLRDQLKVAGGEEADRFRCEHGEMQRKYEDEVAERLKLQRQLAGFAARADAADEAARASALGREEDHRRAEAAAADALALRAQEHEGLELSELLSFDAVPEIERPLPERPEVRPAVVGVGARRVYSRKPSSVEQPADWAITGMCDASLLASGGAAEAELQQNLQKWKARCSVAEASLKTAQADLETAFSKLRVAQATVGVAEGSLHARGAESEASEPAAEVVQPCGRCGELQRELDRLQESASGTEAVDVPTDTAERTVRAEMHETADLSGLASIVGRLGGEAAGARAMGVPPVGIGTSATEDGERDAAQSVLEKEAALTALERRAAQMAAELDDLGQDPASSSDPEARRRMDELQASLRSLDLALFMGEVSLETARWRQSAGGGAFADSSQALLQKIAATCERLTQSLEHTTAAHCHLTQAVDSLQRETMANVASLRASFVVRQDPELMATVTKLENCCTKKDFFQEVPAFERLFRASTFSEAWESRREQIVQEAVARWLPTLKLADGPDTGPAREAPGPLAVVPGRTLPKSTPDAPDRSHSKSTATSSCAGDAPPWDMLRTETASPPESWDFSAWAQLATAASEPPPAPAPLAALLEEATRGAPPLSLSPSAVLGKAVRRLDGQASGGRRPQLAALRPPHVCPSPASSRTSTPDRDLSSLIMGGTSLAGMRTPRSPKPQRLPGLAAVVPSVRPTHLSRLPAVLAGAGASKLAAASSFSALAPSALVGSVGVEALPLSSPRPGALQPLPVTAGLPRIPGNAPGTGDFRRLTSCP